jgi:hypothetical protein
MMEDATSIQIAEVVRGILECDGGGGALWFVYDYGMDVADWAIYNATCSLYRHHDQV